MVNRAIRLREVVAKKDQAIKDQNFEVAADMRAQECAIFEAFGLNIRTGASPSECQYIPEPQIRALSELLSGSRKAGG